MQDRILTNSPFKKAPTDKNPHFPKTFNKFISRKDHLKNRHMKHACLTLVKIATKNFSVKNLLNKHRTSKKMFEKTSLDTFRI